MACFRLDRNRGFRLDRGGCVPLPPRSPVLVLGSIILATHGTPAADQYWDTNGPLGGLAGSGTWNTNGLNLVWNNSSGIGVPAPWTNGNNAFFQPSAGTVTLGAAISAASVTLGVGGYTISNSSSNTLTVTSISTGTASAINATNTRGTNTISAPVILGAAGGTTQTFTQSSGARSTSAE